MTLNLLISDIFVLWYFIFFLGLIPIIYRALMAVDFSKIFRYNSTWQIRLIVLLLSIVLAFLTSYALIYSLERFIEVITN